MLPPKSLSHIEQIIILNAKPNIFRSNGIVYAETFPHRLTHTTLHVHVGKHT